MKKTIVILLAALMVAAAGCQKEETAKALLRRLRLRQLHRSRLPHRQLNRRPLNHRQHRKPLLPHPPVGAPSGGDPHAGLRLKEIPAGTGHKGKVLQVMEAGSYTYLEVEEKGQKLWIAALKTKLNKGDIVEFPDSKPMEKFESKTLKRTFDKIIFAESIRVVK